MGKIESNVLRGSDPAGASALTGTGTNGKVAAWTGVGTLGESLASTAEADFLVGVTSAIQAQIDAAVALVASPSHLLNAAFDVWQEGTSLAVTNGQSKYQADQWYVKNSLGTNGVITFSRQTGGVSGSIYGAQVQITTAPTAAQANGCELYGILDNFDSMRLYGQSASFGINIKALGNVTSVGIQFFYATTEVKLTTAIGSEQAVTVTTGAFALGSILNQALGTSQTTSGVLGVRIRILGVSSGNLYALNNGFIVEQAQLNIGATLRPFKRAFQNHSSEFAALQRYYQTGIAGTGSEGNAAFSTGRWGVSGVNFAQTMRAQPTVDIETNIDDGVTPSSYEANVTNVWGFSFKCSYTSNGEWRVVRQYKADARI